MVLAMASNSALILLLKWQKCTWLTARRRGAGAQRLRIGFVKGLRSDVLLHRLSIGHSPGPSRAHLLDGHIMHPLVAVTVAALRWGEPLRRRGWKQLMRQGMPPQLETQQRRSAAFHCCAQTNVSMQPRPATAPRGLLSFFHLGEVDDV